MTMLGAHGKWGNGREQVSDVERVGR